MRAGATSPSAVASSVPASKENTGAGPPGVKRRPVAVGRRSDRPAVNCGSGARGFGGLAAGEAQRGGGVHRDAPRRAAEEEVGDAVGERGVRVGQAEHAVLEHAARQVHQPVGGRRGPYGGDDPVGDAVEVGDVVGAQPVPVLGGAGDPCRVAAHGVGAEQRGRPVGAGAAGGPREPGLELDEPRCRVPSAVRSVTEDGVWPWDCSMPEPAAAGWPRSSRSAWSSASSSAARVTSTRLAPP